MRFLNGWRLSRCLAGAGLPLLAMLLAAPSVQATCGDYVVLGSNAGHPTGTKGMGESSMPSAGHHDPAGPRAPCHGPLCSQGTPLPLLPMPSAPTSVNAEDLGCLPESLPADGGNLRSHLWDGPSPRPVRRASSVYHPPRLSSASRSA